MLNKSLNILLVISITVFIVSSCERKSGAITEPVVHDTTHVVVRKPNIYIYPVYDMHLIVKLLFPKGGHILESIPKYQNGWDILVDPTGLIDHKYSFLYYECSVPSIFRKDRGWVVEQEKLKDFFKKNMSAYGFNKTEIADFISYWIPKLDNSEKYVLYPQLNEDISSTIRLDFSDTPDTILRLFYFIEPFKNEVIIDEPAIPNTDRKGYSVAEWGVILKE